MGLSLIDLFFCGRYLAEVQGGTFAFFTSVNRVSRLLLNINDRREYLEENIDMMRS